MRTMKSTCLTIGLLVCGVVAPALATTRETALVHARSYANYPWRSTASNQSASCSAAYESLFPTGDYVGLPYDWGGYMTLDQFSDLMGGLGYKGEKAERVKVKAPEAPPRPGGGWGPASPDILTPVCRGGAGRRWW